MNVNEAIELLDLKIPIKECDLKKCYYRKCLQYHPDKNSDGLEMFKKINTAYNILINANIDEINKDKINKKNSFNNFIDKIDITNLSYIEILNNYISTFSNKYDWDNEYIKNSIQKIILGAQDISLTLFDNLEPEKAVEIYEFISKYSSIFNIGTSILDTMKEKLKNKIVDSKVIILNPSLEDLMNDKIYVLDVDEERFYVPLWHNELYYKDNYIVRIIPELKENIYIDEENNIHIMINKNISSILDEKRIHLNIGNNMVYIDVCDLKIKKYQTICLLNKGISKINEKDIFKNKLRSNIIIHMTLS